MAFTNTAGLIDDLAGMTVSGINRVYDHPMIQVNTAELPVMFIGFPEIDQEVETLVAGLAQTFITIEVILLVAPALHNLNKANFDTSAALMDATQVSLKANALDFGLNSWRIQMATHQMGDTTYWAVVATVTASGGVE